MFIRVIVLILRSFWTRRKRTIAYISSYLRSVMLDFGFPFVLVDSLIGLSFGNRVRININSHLTNEINQCCCLTRDDPLSPLLFKLALEPFLQHTLQDNSFHSFAFTPLITGHLSLPKPSPALKVLAYADDVCFLLYLRRLFLGAASSELIWPSV
jgi:hypothetical protein